MAGTDKAGLMTICSSWGWKLHNPGRIGVRNKWPIQTISVTFLFAVAMTGCVAVISRPEFGVNDQAAANKIDRVNELAALRNQGRFVELANHLEADLSKFSQNTYAVLRIRNELAEIYSYLLLDIERAIAIDEVIAKMPLSDMDAGGAFVPQFSVARQRILSDESYLNNYIKVSQSTISEAVKKRLETNKALMRVLLSIPKPNIALSFFERTLQGWPTMYRAPLPVLLQENACCPV